MITLLHHAMLLFGQRQAECNEGKNFDKYFHQFSYYILDQLLFNFYVNFFSTIIYDKCSPHFGQFDCSHFDPKEFQPNPFSEEEGVQKNQKMLGNLEQLNF